MAFFASLLLLVAGFVVLSYSSAEAVKRLVRLSRHFNISEFIISFLLIGILSVLPELSIGINSALAHSSSFGLGVVFGSNVADLTLVLGIIAIFAGDIKLRRPTIRQAKWFLLAILFPVMLMGDGQISRWDAATLLVGFGGYLYWIFTNRRKVREEENQPKINVLADSGVMLAALILLFGSGKIITHSAVDISTIFKIPVLFIGLIVAIGTCLPEFIFALQAARKGHAELGFGNILGNVFSDCMLVPAIIAFIQPITPDVPVLALTTGFFMAFAMAAVIIILNGKNKISRRDGLLMVSFYIIFLLLQLIIESTL